MLYFNALHPHFFWKEPKKARYQEGWRTSFVVSAKINEFIEGKPFADPAQGYQYEPAWISYG